MDIKSSADRLGPPDVPPIYHEGVVYTQDENGPGGVLVASDDETGKALWTLKIYDVKIDKALEADAQWVFFCCNDVGSGWTPAHRQRSRQGISR